MQDHFHGRTAGLAVVELVALIALPGAALAQTSVPSRAARRPGSRLLTAASWHGRSIRRPEPARSVSVRARAPGGARLRVGTGFVRRGGSDRVRDVQRRLTRLGYRPGRADGLYGPRTQAAVIAFQRKHGLARTGTVGPATRVALRQHLDRGTACRRGVAPVRQAGRERPCGGRRPGDWVTRGADARPGAPARGMRDRSDVRREVPVAGRTPAAAHAVAQHAAAGQARATQTRPVVRT